MDVWLCDRTESDEGKDVCNRRQGSASRLAEHGLSSGKEKSSGATLNRWLKGSSSVEGTSSDITAMEYRVVGCWDLGCR